MSNTNQLRMNRIILVALKNLKCMSNQSLSIFFT